MPSEVVRSVDGTKQFRSFHVERKAIDEENRTVSLAFSSEAEYERFFGIEILDHGAKSVRLGRLKDGAAFLVNHNTDDQVGVFESVEIGKDRVGRAMVRFGESARAEEIWRDIVTGIRKHVSVGYIVHKMVLDEETKDGPDKYRVTDWEPFEASIVPVPADTTVGVGRSAEIEAERATEPEEKESHKMSDKNTETIVTPEVPTVDIKAESEKARNSEIDRLRKIEKLGRDHNQVELANQFKDNGKSVDEFKSAILERMENVKVVNETADIGMSNREVKRFSFIKAIAALANPNDRRVQDAAAFERECSQAVEGQMKTAARGIIVPQDVLKRDLTVGTDADGGYLVGTDHDPGSFIGALYNHAKVMQMGARPLAGLVGDLAVPKMSSGHTAYWVAEDGAPTVSTPTLGQLSLSPKTVGAYSDISRQLLLQSSPDAENMVQSDLAMTLALGIDLAALHGSGSSNQPTGIASTSGVGSVAGGTNGLAPANSHIIGLETAVAVDNGDVGRSGYLTNAKVRGVLKQTYPNTTGGDSPVWQNGQNGSGFMNGYRAEVSNQVSSTLTKGSSTSVCSAIFFSGAWDRLIVAMWGGLDLTLDPYSLSTTGQLRVVGFQSVDIGLRTPESFSVMLDALTA
jgi:HK97 family phage major capsid protein/HK97 family phage prohead protease